MTNNEFYNTCNAAFAAFQKYAPNEKTRGIGYYKNKYGNWCKKSTGNLAFNAAKIETYGDSATIYVDEEVAPYMPYTTEKWISPKWKGHKNPNEGWFDRSSFVVAEALADNLRKSGYTALIRRIR